MVVVSLVEELFGGGISALFLWEEDKIFAPFFVDSGHLADGYISTVHLLSPLLFLLLLLLRLPPACF
jgi:hypothetical protein